MDHAKSFDAFKVKSQRLEQHHESRQMIIFLKIGLRLFKGAAIEVSPTGDGIQGSYPLDVLNAQAFWRGSGP